MNLTTVGRLIFAPRLRAARLWRDGSAVEDVQRAELARMVRMARNTEWGRAHDFRNISSYEDYRERAGRVTSYPELRPYVMRMIKGERDVLWPGATRHFAQSSGTGDGRSKYIPVTDEGFVRCHYRGARHTVAHYLDNVPNSNILSGKALILGGSFANELDLPPHVMVGDLSANLIRRMPAWADFLRVPSRRIALMEDWSKKLPLLARAAARDRRITNLSGVPSWFLGVIKEVLHITGASSLHDVWPNLEVFFHGGIAFGPYREQYERLTDKTRMHFLENYNASEGFFAVQDDLATPAMLLLLNTGTFYEFIPVDDLDSDSPRLLPAWELSQGSVYGLVVSNVNGLWRYPVGDTVRVGSVAPLRISIAGRTSHYINAFGEELMVCNADDALAATCKALDCDVSNYTAAPVYADSHHRGRHQWLIEFARMPGSLEEFAERLDTELCRVNSDYAAKRKGTIFLDPLTVTVAQPGVFDRWLAESGKLGGQRKIPRLHNDRRIIDALLRINLPSDD